MTAEERQKVLSRIDNEGFHYCFESYSSFREIKDKEFHRLREAYLKAARDLEDYLKGLDS